MFQPSNSFGDPLAFRTILCEEAQEHLANVERSAAHGKRTRRTRTT